MIRITRLIKSFGYAFKGLFKVIKEEQNIQIQSFFAIAILAIGYYVDINRIEWALLVLVIGLVIIMEVLNSAVERVTDVLKPRINTYVKEIKDIMAAAVMIASFIAILVGILIFLPYIKPLQQLYMIF